MNPESNEPAGDQTPQSRPRAERVQPPSPENELWDLDETPLEKATPLVPVNRAQTAPRRPEEELPEPPQQPVKPTPKAVDLQPRNLKPPKPELQPRPCPLGDRVRPYGSDLGELDTSDWEDAPVAASEPEPVPVQQPAPAVESPEPAPPASTEAAPEPAVPEILSETLPEEPEAKPATAPAAPAHEPARMSTLEKAGLISLAVLLLFAAAAFVIVSVKKLPSDESLTKAADFPVKGRLLTVKRVETFWRKPAEHDTARRETKLLPVLTLDADGGPAALRIFFRNAQGEVVGDSVTRSVQSGTLEFAATAGFETEGLHAAYRTGESKPWKVEVYEAPSVDSPRQEFKKLFESPISPDRR